MYSSDDSANILSSNIYRLLLKNVTRNDPFTSDEVDVSFKLYQYLQFKKYLEIEMLL